MVAGQAGSLNAAAREKEYYDPLAGLDGPQGDPESLHHRALRECHKDLLRNAQSQLSQIFVEYEEKLLQLLREAQTASKASAVKEATRRLKENGANMNIGDLEELMSPRPAEKNVMEQPKVAADKSSSKPHTNSDGDTIGIGENRGGLLSINVGSVDLEQMVYRVEDYYYKKGFSQHLARSDLFNKVTMSFIAINAVYLGLDSELNKAELLADADVIWIICENIFCFFFTFEILARFFAFQNKLNCIRDGWFKFDSCLVTLMIFEVWGMLMVDFLGGQLSGLPTAPLRLLRLLRLARLVRLLRAMPELVTMIKGMRAASRAVISSIVLVLFLVYVFSIVMLMVCKGMAKGDDEHGQIIKNSFGRLLLCMWTMTMDGTFMLETDTILTALREANSLDGFVAIFIFLTFMLLSSLTVLNMLIGILCEVVTAVGQSERDEADVTLVKRGILNELLKFDIDGDGTISQNELEHVMKSAQARAVLNELEVNASSLEQLHDMWFKRSTDVVAIRKIMETCLDYRGNQTPTVKHLVDGMVFNRHFTEKLVTNNIQNLTTTVIHQNQALIKALEETQNLTGLAHLRTLPSSTGSPSKNPADAKSREATEQQLVTFPLHASL